MEEEHAGQVLQQLGYFVFLEIISGVLLSLRRHLFFHFTCVYTVLLRYDNLQLLRCARNPTVALVFSFEVPQR